MPGSRDRGLILNLNLLPGGTAKGSWRLDDRDSAHFVTHHHYGLAPRR